MKIIICHTLESPLIFPFFLSVWILEIDPLNVVNDVARKDCLINLP